MTKEYDWWSFLEPLLDVKQIRMLNETILNNYESEEDTRAAPMT